MDKTPTPMSEEPNTTQSAEEFLNSRMFTHSTGMFCIDIVNARAYARLYHSEQLSQAKMPTQDDLDLYTLHYIEHNLTPSRAEAYQAGWNDMRSQVLPYITKLEEQYKGEHQAYYLLKQESELKIQELELANLNWRKANLELQQENAELKKHGYDNMQYYMEYCQRNGYVTPQEWIEKHKHF